MAETKRSPHSLEAIAVGTVVSIELKEIKPKDTSKPAFHILRAEISAAGSKIRTEVWPSKRKPSLPQDLMEQLGQGMKVSARGALEEQIGEDQRLYRSMRAWTISQAEAHEEPKLVYHIAGMMGRLEKTGAGEHVVPITCVRTFGEGDQKRDDEKTLRVCPPTAMVEALYVKAKIPVGTIIRARGDIIAKTEFDRFGLPSGEFVNRLDVALLEVWDAQKELWMRLDEVLLTAPAGVASTTQTTPTAPTSLTRPITANNSSTGPNNLEDDVPF